MAAVHLGDPPKPVVTRERISKLSQGPRDGLGKRIWKLPRHDERRAERRGGQVRDRKTVTDEVAARLKLCLDTVEGGSHLGRSRADGRRVDPVAELVEHREDREHRSHSALGAFAEAHPERESGNHTVRVVHEHRAEDCCAELMPELLVEEVLQLHGAPARGFVARIERGIRAKLLERLEDSRRVADRLPLEKENRQCRAPGRPERSRQVVEEEGFPDVRDPLEIQRPANLLVEVRDGEMPEDGGGRS